MSTCCGERSVKYVLMVLGMRPMRNGWLSQALSVYNIVHRGSI